MDCYAFRVSKKYVKELSEELEIGHLRQGWGYDEKLNLRHANVKKNPKAKRNLPIMNEVSKGDFILVLNMPDNSSVTLAIASKDFSKGYIYDEESMDCKDFGHIFPAERIAVIRKTELSENLRRSFFCRLRFFRLKKHENEIKDLANKYMMK